MNSTFKLKAAAVIATLIMSAAASAASLSVIENQSIISSFPEYNYGDNDFRGGLFVGRVAQDDGSDPFVRFYLKFKLPKYISGTSVTLAVLESKYFDSFSYGNDIFSINEALSSSWSASTLTWSNQPGYVEPPVAVFNSAAFVPSWDVSSVVDKHYQTDGVVSLVFKVKNESLNSPLQTWKYFEKWEAGKGGSFVINYNLSPVPEPSVYAMLLVGLAVTGCMTRRTRRSS